MMMQARTLNLDLEPIGADVTERCASSTPHKVDLFLLSRQMNVEQLFEVITINCLAQIAANAAALVQCYDAETLHQMRVGLRRLSVALDIFKDLLQLPLVLQQELDWLNAQLSAARDWDVLAETTLLTLATELPDLFQRMIKLPAVKRAVLGRARQQHASALAAVRSARCLSLIQQLSDWLERCAWRDTLSAKCYKRLHKPAAKFTHNSLLQQQHRLVKRCQLLPSDSQRVVHRVRIAAKTMHYAAEFFQSLYARKKIQPSILYWTKLQRRLGRINDAAVADDLLLQIQQQRPQLATSIHLMRVYMRLRTKDDAKKISASLKKYRLIKLAI